ncbi:MAG: YdcF family protein [Granulosicoccus sp.]
MTELIQNWFLDPVALLFLLSLVTILVLIYRRQRLKGPGVPVRYALIVITWSAFFFLFASPNVVHPLLLSVENQYPETLSCEQGSHLVMLGGGVDSRAQSPLEFERMSDSTLSRATAAARIAQSEPQLRIIAAGGAVKHITEADIVASYWVALGIDNVRILRERQSLNTRENAVNVAALLATESIENPVRLITSALHMPRALRTFRKVLDDQGVAVCPVSVDREGQLQTPWWAWMPQTTTIWKFDKLLHEVIALGVYRWRGWI